MGSACVVVLALAFIYMICAYAFFLTDDALRERQKKIDGCCAQCKDLSNKKGDNDEK
jgi:hypothetical protein